MKTSTLFNSSVKPKTAFEIVKNDNSITRDVQEVLKRWYKDISSLYSGLQNTPDIAFNDDFYDSILRKKEEFEALSNMEQIRFTDRVHNLENLNVELSLKEVSDAIDKTKCGKSYLEIPNEVLKNPNE